MFGWLKSGSHFDETDVVAYDARNAAVDDDEEGQAEITPQENKAVESEPEEIEKFQKPILSCKEGFPFILGSRNFMLLPTKSSRNAYSKQQAIIQDELKKLTEHVKHKLEESNMEIEEEAVNVKTEETELETGSLMSEVDNASDEKYVETDASMVEDMPLEILLNEENMHNDDDLDEKSLDTFKASLQSLFLPVDSQVDVEKGKDFKLSDFYADCLNTLKLAFENKIEERKLETFHKNMLKDAASHDVTMEILRSRKEALSSNEFYSTLKSADLSSWKDEQEKLIDKYLEIASAARTKATNFVLQIQLNRVLLKRTDKLKGKSSVELMFTIDKHKVKSNIKKVLFNEGKGDIPFPWKEEKIMISTAEPESFSIQFFTKSTFSKQEFGSIDINFKGLLMEISNYDKLLWGKKSVDITVDIVSKSDLTVAKADLSISVQFQKFPPQMYTSLADKQKKAKYFEMYYILIQHIIKEKQTVLEVNKSKSGPLYSESEKWLIDQFAKLYCISSPNYLLATLQALVYRIDLLIEHFSEVNEMITELNASKLYSNEKQRFSSILAQLVDRLEKILGDFSRYFYKKPNELKVFLNTFTMMKIHIEKLKPSDVKEIIKERLKEALKKEYDSILEIGRQEHHSSQTALLCYVSSQMVKKLNQIKELSSAFEKEIEFEKIALRALYVHNFADQVTLLLQNFGNHSKTNGSSFGILQLCYEVQVLHAEMRKLFGSDLVDSFAQVNVTSVAKEYASKYMEEIKLKLETLSSQAVTMEKSIQGVLHGTSAVDVYSACNQFYEILKTLDFVTEDMLQHFLKIVLQVSVHYAQQCIMAAYDSFMFREDLPAKIVVPKLQRPMIDFSQLKRFFTAKVVNPVEDAYFATHQNALVNLQFVLKWNDLFAAKSELNSLVQKITKKETSYFAFAETNVQLNSTSLETMIPFYFSQLNQLIQTLTTSISCMFRPVFVAMLQNIVFVSSAPEAVKQAIVQYLDQILTPNLYVLNIALYDNLFVNLLETLFESFVQAFHDLIFDASLEKCIPVSQLNLLQTHVVPLVFDYFSNCGALISKQKKDSLLQQLQQWITICSDNTETLIQKLQQETNSSMETKYELFALLRQHAKQNNSMALEFLQTKHLLTISIAKKWFQLEETNATPLHSITAVYNELTLGHLYLFTTHICFVPYLLQHHQEKAIILELQSISEFVEAFERGRKEVQLTLKNEQQLSFRICGQKVGTVLVKQCKQIVQDLLEQEIQKRIRERIEAKKRELDALKKAQEHDKKESAKVVVKAKEIKEETSAKAKVVSPRAEIAPQPTVAESSAASTPVSATSSSSSSSSKKEKEKKKKDSKESKEAKKKEPKPPKKSGLFGLLKKKSKNEEYENVSEPVSTDASIPLEPTTSDSGKTSQEKSIAAEKQSEKIVPSVSKEQPSTSVQTSTVVQTTSEQHEQESIPPTSPQKIEDEPSIVSSPDPSAQMEEENAEPVTEPAEEKVEHEETENFESESEATHNNTTFDAQEEEEDHDEDEEEEVDDDGDVYEQVQTKLKQAEKQNSQKVVSMAEKFGLPSTEKVIDQFKCGISRNNEGYLYLFLTCLGFESLAGIENETIHMASIASIEKKKEVGKSGRIQIFLLDGSMKEFRRFLQHKKAYKLIYGQWNAYKKLYANVISPVVASTVTSDTVTEQGNASDEEEQDTMTSPSMMESTISDASTATASIASPSIKSPTSVNSPSVVDYKSQYTAGNSATNTTSASSPAPSLKTTLAEKFAAKPELSKKEKKFEKRKQFFFERFQIEPLSEQFLMGTKATFKKDSHTYKGKLYIGSKTLAFEPTVASEKGEVKVSLLQVKTCSLKSPKLSILKGKSLMLGMKDGSVYEFFVPKYEEAFQHVMKNLKK